MITLTRLNGNALWLNADLVESLEATPDTVLVLLDGRRVLVRETCQTVRDAIVAYRAEVLAVAVAATGCGCAASSVEPRLALHSGHFPAGSALVAETRMRVAREQADVAPVPRADAAGAGGTDEGGEGALA